MTEGSKVTLGLSSFPPGALGFGLPRPLGAFRRTPADGGSGVALGVGVLSVGAVLLVVLLTAQLPRGRPGTQRPLLVGLAEGVGAELAEGVRVLPADVTVVPGAVPAA